MRKWTILLSLVAATAQGDEIELRGGGRVSGVIVERTETAFVVDIGAGRITVPAANVVRVSEGASPLGDYRERAARIAPNDVEAWRELGRWAARAGLASQSREAFRNVLAADPGDPEANRALGRVLVGGKWMKEADAYRAQGYVEFEGEWLTPAEHQAILDERAAADQAERRELEAEIRAGEEEIRVDREREAAERQAWWDERHTTGSDMVYWGWGMGPELWPSEADEPSGARGFEE